MVHLLVLATVLTACVADEVPLATSPPEILIHNDYHRLENLRLRQSLERLRHNLNIPNNPHSHLDDPYRNNQRESLGQRRDEFYTQRDKYDNRRDKYDNRRDEYDDRRDDKGRGRDVWNDQRVKQEPQWWTDKDKIEHVDDNKDVCPVILRTIKSHEDHHKPDIARQNKIIEDVYSPDYAPPTWYIDYRYLKTGGRDYTRGPGGQIIILPKGIRTNEQKEFKDYDELIEHLKQQNLKEQSKPRYFMPLGQEINKSHKQNDDDDDKKWYN